MSGEVVTIHDIAREAQVSASTVSNLLNGRTSRMRADTQARVLETMQRLNYRPSRLARQLRTGRVTTIGLVVPSVANPFWGSWARAVEAEALAGGYQVVLCNSQRDAAREREYVEELWLSGVRSVIVATSLLSLEHLRPVIDQGLQIIAFDRERQESDPPGIVNVSVDNRLGGFMATQHLVKLGHSAIGFISGPITTVSRQRRLAGYKEALGVGQIDLRPELVWEDQEGSGFGDLDSATVGRRGAHALLSLREPPTALVTVNDMYAIGACAAIRDLGLTVPGISVVGFDDIAISALYNPPLTTVRQPLEEMAKMALEVVEGARELDGAESRSVPEMVVRSSTSGPPPRRANA